LLSTTRGVHAHAPPRNHPAVPRYFHHPVLNLRNDLRPQCQAPAAHSLGVGRLAGADAGERPVHEIGAHLALQHLIAPVANVLQNQQPQHHLGRRADPTTTAALGTPLGQRFVHRYGDVLVLQDLIDILHPDFPQILYLCGDQTIAEVPLRPSHLNHDASSSALPSPDPGAADDD